MLRDSIIHFGEDLPSLDLQRGSDHADQAKVALCIGTSLHVTPAADLPQQCVRNGGVMFVVNLQSTGRDEEALQTGGVLIHAKCDQVMQALMNQLGYNDMKLQDQPVFEQSELKRREQIRQTEVKQNEAKRAHNKRSTERKEEKGAGRFFHLMGLPPTLSQLPPFLTITQTHEHRAPTSVDDPNTHKWSLSLDVPSQFPNPLSDYVDKVEFFLHETFGDNAHITCAQAPYSVGPFQGWGTFDVKVLVTFKEGFGKASRTPLRAVHSLRFDQDTSQTKMKVPQMKMNKGFLARVTNGVALRKVETRVRDLNGNVTIETRT